ncbi:MAG: septation ring formation regulator EzrA [Defluviitaleaceae bacterium]|nr:septation ring formation regulator EzrA [Defluviitaleaceae bacterium]
MIVWIFVGISVGLGFLLLAYLVGRAKRGTYRGIIEKLENRRFEISEKPVMFELAKLKSVRKSSRIIELVSQWEKRWEIFEEQLTVIEDNIAYVEESVRSGEFERADEIIDITGNDLTDVAEKVEALLAEIENLKTSESRNRDGIMKLRQCFANLNDKYEENQSIYEAIETEIEAKFRQIKADFETFDTHMEASNYDLADEASDQLEEKLDLIGSALEKIPLYRESIEIDIQPMLDGMLESYEAMLNKGLFLEHLKVKSVVAQHKKELERVPELLKKFDFSEIEKLLIKVPTEAKKLRDEMKHEIDVKESFDSDLAQLKIDAGFVVKESKLLTERYDEIKAHCLMRRDDEENFKSLIHEINIVDVGVSNLLSEIEAEKTAISDLHTSVLRYLTQLGEIKEQLGIFDSEIASLQKGSEDMRAQAIDLLTKINQLKSTFEKTMFTTHVSAYKLTLDKADNQISELLEEANKTPLDVAKVRFSLKMSLEMMNKAEHEVALAIEQLKMAERLLVYGNRYSERGGMYVMDLTIAEDQFHQGNYRAVIDKMHQSLTSVEGTSFSKIFEGLKQELGCVML